MHFFLDGFKFHHKILHLSNSRKHVISWEAVMHCTLLRKVIKDTNQLWISRSFRPPNLANLGSKSVLDSPKGTHPYPPQMRRPFSFHPPSPTTTHPIYSFEHDKFIISWKKLSFALFFALVWDFAHFPLKIWNFFICSMVSGAFLHLFTQWQLFWHQNDDF